VVSQGSIFQQEKQCAYKVMLWYVGMFVLLKECKGPATFYAINTSAKWEGHFKSATTDMQKCARFVVILLLSFLFKYNHVHSNKY